MFEKDTLGTGKQSFGSETTCCQKSKILAKFRGLLPKKTRSSVIFTSAVPIKSLGGGINQKVVVVCYRSARWVVVPALTGNHSNFDKAA